MPKKDPRTDAYIAKDTRLRRLTTAIALMTEGKSQNWKYVKK